MFKGQTFCHHRLSESSWSPWRIHGLEYRDTGGNKATQGIAAVQVARLFPSNARPQLCSHNTDILFCFLTNGRLDLQVEGHPQKTLNKGDAFVMPPYLKYQFSNYTEDLELLEVSLPGNFQTFDH